MDHTTGMSIFNSLLLFREKFISGILTFRYEHLNKQIPLSYYILTINESLVIMRIYFVVIEFIMRLHQVR